PSVLGGPIAWSRKNSTIQTFHGPRPAPDPKRWFSCPRSRASARIRAPSAPPGAEGGSSTPIPGEEMAEHSGMMRSASAMSITTMLSRILGYFRDNLQATILGAANVSDAFIIAYRIPNLLRRLVGEGALTSAFVPTFARYLKDGDRAKLWR